LIQVIFIIIIILLSYLLLILRILILVSFHPIFIGMLILILCLFVRIIICLMTHSWLSFLLFYLIRGGILMLLLYISCFSFNPIFKKRFLSLVVILGTSFIVFKQHFFIFKKAFSDLIIRETGIRLRNPPNIWIFVLISLFIFMCFF